VVRDLLACPTANFDLNGLKAACDLARNLAVAARRQPQTRHALLLAGAVPSLVLAAVAKARDQNAAASAAAALRLLLDTSDDNGAGDTAGPVGAAAAVSLPAVPAAPAAPLSVTAAEGAVASAENEPLAAAVALAPCVAAVLAARLDSLHPFARVELARALAVATPRLAEVDRRDHQTAAAETSRAAAATTATTTTTAAPAVAAPAAEGPTPGPADSAAAMVAVSATALAAGAAAAAGASAVAAALALLSGRGGVEFMGFLLASSQPLLHAEAAAALAALRRASRHAASADAPPTLPPPAPAAAPAAFPAARTAVAPASPPAARNGGASAAAASAALQALPLPRGALCCDPMAVGACVGAGDGTTEQSLADRLAAIRSAGGAGGLGGPARRRFEADLAFLLAGN
jgi:hypothetical protein